MKHFLTLEDYSKEEIFQLIDCALRFKRGEQNNPRYQHIFATNLFLEPSTRTKVSFEMAERKLSMEVLPFDVSMSSIEKGESLFDTVKTLEAIGVNVLVIRHPQEKYYDCLKDIQTLALVNGGDGTGSHPSQALLDLMTIYEHFGAIRGLNICISGDLLHSRVARSNIQLLERLGANVYLAAPTFWRLDKGKYVDLDDVMEKMDVMMLLRNQYERHKSVNNAEDYLNLYGLTKQRAEKLPKSSIIMHPAPVNRNVEIATELVEGKKSKIFTQMQNGVYARMAILAYCLQ